MDSGAPGHYFLLVRPPAAAGLKPELVFATTRPRIFEEASARVKAWTQWLAMRKSVPKTVG